MAAMTMTNMLSMLRRRLRDQNSSTWKDNADLRDELNSAASRVVRLLHRNEIVNLDSGSEDITTLAKTTAYALASTTIRRLFKMVEVLTNDVRVPCVQIPEDTQDWRTRSNRNSLGYWQYYLTRAASTGKYTINFPRYQTAGLTFRVFGQTVLTAKETDGTEDGQSYTQIPEDYHELVVQEAVLALLDQSSSSYGGAIRIHRVLSADLVGDVSRGNEPARIINGYQ